MRTALKYSSYLTAVTLSLFTALPAAAQDSTLSRLQALEAEIASLKAQIAIASSDVELIKARPTPMGAKAKKMKPSKGFMVGDTNVRVGGFVDLDVHLTKTTSGQISEAAIAGAGLDQYIPALTPVGPDSTDNDIRTDFTVQSSRLAVSTSTPAAKGNIQTHIEMDFLLSPGGNELVSNSFNPRLRRAYVDYNGWRVGQEWSTFQGLHAIPESASFYAPAESQVFDRQPLIRYTKGNFQFALENPNTRIQGGPSIGDDGLIPDVVARYNMKGGWGIVSLSGIARQLSYKTDTIDAEAFGYGASIAGRVKVGEQDDIRFTLQGGEGLGRYIGLGVMRGAQFDAATGDIDPIGSISGNVAYRHVMGPWSANVGLSYLDIDLDESILANATSTKKSQSAYIAVLRKVAPKMTVGMEFLSGKREVVSGEDGVINRATFSVRQGF